MVYGEAEGELSVGGVFLRIFIAQPAWVLRKPREFLIALLEKFTELLEKNNPHVRWIFSWFYALNLFGILTFLVFYCLINLDFYNFFPL